jgi:hypothetical protein
VASTAYWSFVFCLPRKVVSGRNRSLSPSNGSGSARLAPHQFSASAARRGTPRRGRCCHPGAEAQARSPARRSQRRGRARRAGHDGRSCCPQGSAASWQEYHDGRAEPPIAGRPFQQMPVGRCSAATPPARHAASLPYKLPDAREPPIWRQARPISSVSCVVPEWSFCAGVVRPELDSSSIAAGRRWRSCSMERHYEVLIPCGS